MIKLILLAAEASRVVGASGMCSNSRQAAQLQSLVNAEKASFKMETETVILGIAEEPAASLAVICLQSILSTTVRNAFA